MLWTIFRLRTFQFCSRRLQIELQSPRTFFSSSVMAKSKFEYVREFESHDTCLPNCFIVVRVDGKGFHKFTEAHEFEKPNDRDGLLLMSKAAACVMEEFNDICCAYGQSDEFSFVFNRDTNVYKRRNEKILSVVNSLFTSSYVFFWDKFIPRKLKYPPAFDARIILYPTIKNLRDYLCWRQADAHINNLYNTAFWGLVQKCGCTKQEAEKILCGTVSSEKHEIMFKNCNINYNNECELYKKGTLLVKRLVPSSKGDSGDSSLKTVYVPLNCDIIQDKFWTENSHLLNSNMDTPVEQEILGECQLVFLRTKNTCYDPNKKANKKKNRNPQRKNQKESETNGVME